MWNRVLGLSLALLVLPVDRAAAGVLVVDASGGGAFTDLPAAVAAAADGDILLLKSGAYTAPTIANKALDVVADTGASVVVQGPFAVTDLTATRAVTITGVT